MIEFSIIIVNYNNCRILKQCLESIIKFTLDVSYEIIVVDNNSTMCDVKKVIGQFSDITFIQNSENMGFASANNLGARVAKGKFLLILNNDTIFIENTLKKISGFLKTKEEDLILGCSLLNADGSNQQSVAKFESYLTVLGISIFLYKIFPKWSLINKYYLNLSNNNSDEVEVDIVKGAFLVISRSSWEKLSGFDEKFYFFGEESDLCYRFKKTNGRVILYTGTKVIHLGGATATDQNWFKYKNAAIARIKFFQKHYSFFKRWILYSLHLIGILLRILQNLIEGVFTINKKKLIKSFFYFKSLFVFPKNQFKSER